MNISVRKSTWTLGFMRLHFSYEWRCDRLIDWNHLWLIPRSVQNYMLIGWGLSLLQEVKLQGILWESFIVFTKLATPNVSCCNRSGLSKFSIHIVSIYAECRLHMIKSVATTENLCRDQHKLANFSIEKFCVDFAWERHANGASQAKSVRGILVGSQCRATDRPIMT